MKYIKYFESISHSKDLQEYRDDVIKVLTKYCKEHDDKLSYELEKLMWEFSDTDDRYNSIGVIDEECIRMLIDNALENSTGWNDKLVGQLLDIYYDCRSSNTEESLIDQIEEIFADYKDEGMIVKVSKSSDKGDDRYVISINTGDDIEILTKISFGEVINRIKDIGLPHLNFIGTNNHIRLEFWKEYHEDDDLGEGDDPNIDDR